MTILRKEIRKKRKALCEEQAMLEREVCATCPLKQKKTPSDGVLASCDSCLFACSFREIGEEIRELSLQQRKQMLDTLVADAKENGFSVDAYEALQEVFDSETEVNEYLYAQLNYTRRFLESWKLVYITRPARFENISAPLYFDLYEQGYTVREMAKIFGISPNDLQCWKEANELTDNQPKKRRNKNEMTRFELWQSLYRNQPIDAYLTWLIQCKKTFVKASKSTSWKSDEVPPGKSPFDVYVRQIISIRVACGE